MEFSGFRKYVTQGISSVSNVYPNLRTTSGYRIHLLVLLLITANVNSCPQLAGDYVCNPTSDALPLKIKQRQHKLGHTEFFFDTKGKEFTYLTDNIPKEAYLPDISEAKIRAGRLRLKPI
jgi:hypothetical protein